MTKLKYLQDTYVFQANAMFMEIRENEKGKAVVLDETIFYPQGWGQPPDKGQIVSDNAIFSVNDTRLDENGTVLHFWKFEKGEFQKGDKVVLKTDKDRRIKNAKCHSAGHLLDCAVKQMGLNNLEPIKGFHFPDGPYVEYKGIIENPTDIIPVLEKTVNTLIMDNLHVEKQNLSPEEAKAQGIWAPTGKSARVVKFSRFPSCGCWGTHVNSASEIGKITIRKIKSKKGTTKIAYSVE